jgi:hypothetical protein
MQRFQIHLRLMMLLVTLLAVVFAWMGAVRSRAVAERAVVRWNLEADLRSEVRWRDILQNNLRNPSGPSHHNSVARQIPDVEARIAKLRNRLEN